MAFTEHYSSEDLSRADVDAMPGLAVLEFGNSWCGHCRRTEPLLKAAFASRAEVRHIRVADASGRRLGRSFGVKLWPTLVFLKDGQEVERLVRPLDPDVIERAFGTIARG